MSAYGRRAYTPPSTGSPYAYTDAPAANPYTNNYGPRGRTPPVGNVGEAFSPEVYKAQKEATYYGLQNARSRNFTGDGAWDQDVNAAANAMRGREYVPVNKAKEGNLDRKAPEFGSEVYRANLENNVNNMKEVRLRNYQGSGVYVQDVNAAADAMKAKDYTPIGKAKEGPIDRKAPEFGSDVYRANLENNINNMAQVRYKNYAGSGFYTQDANAAADAMNAKEYHALGKAKEGSLDRKGPEFGSAVYKAQIENNVNNMAEVRNKNFIGTPDPYILDPNAATEAMNAREYHPIGKPKEGPLDRKAPEFGSDVYRNQIETTVTYLAEVKNKNFVGSGLYVPDSNAASEIMKSKDYHPLSKAKEGPLDRKPPAFGSDVYRSQIENNVNNMAETRHKNFVGTPDTFETSPTAAAEAMRAKEYHALPKPKEGTLDRRGSEFGSDVYRAQIENTHTNMAETKHKNYVGTPELYAQDPDAAAMAMREKSYHALGKAKEGSLDRKGPEFGSAVYRAQIENNVSGMKETRRRNYEGSGIYEPDSNAAVEIMNSKEYHPLGKPKEGPLDRKAPEFSSAVYRAQIENNVNNMTEVRNRNYVGTGSYAPDANAARDAMNAREYHPLGKAKEGPLDRKAPEFGSDVYRAQIENNVNNMAAVRNKNYVGTGSYAPDVNAAADAMKARDYFPLSKAKEGNLDRKAPEFGSDVYKAQIENNVNNMKEVRLKNYVGTALEVEDPTAAADAMNARTYVPVPKKDIGGGSFPGQSFDAEIYKANLEAAVSSRHGYKNKDSLVFDEGAEPVRRQAPDFDPEVYRAARENNHSNMQQMKSRNNGNQVLQSSTPNAAAEEMLSREYHAKPKQELAAKVYTVQDFDPAVYKAQLESNFSNMQISKARNYVGSKVFG